MSTLALRTKFLLALALISAAITSAVLLVVRYRVEVRVREQLEAGVDNSIVAFERLQQQRAVTLERSAALLAALPTLKALMTSDDPNTIQDASEAFWQLAGSQVFALADRAGTISAFHASTPEFPREAAQRGLTQYLSDGRSRDWWFGGGHLFQVFLQPISVGGADAGYSIGLLAVGYEINRAVADDVSRVASSHVMFGYDRRPVVSTVTAGHPETLLADTSNLEPSGAREVQLGDEAFLARTVSLAPGADRPITLTVLEPLAESSRFLDNLNRWIVAIGAAGITVGSLLVFFVSTTFTRPLARLVSGVRALEAGDFEFPLDGRGGDEVAALTRAFSQMRRQLHASQRRLIEAERMATIGRVASSISHDLRHPLTAIQAYTEFLAERDLSEEKRKDYFQEIRLAINHMTDELNALLGFSHERQPLRCVTGRLDEVVDRAIRTVKALPEFEHVDIGATVGPECVASFDAGKIERVLVNLLFNAAEAVSRTTGRIEVAGSRTGQGVDIRVTDNGPGVPEDIVGTLFDPFVSQGKQRGTGLGLTVVHNVMQQHGGTATLESTGPDGTTFVLQFPSGREP